MNSKGKLLQLIYISNATHKMSPKELEDMLAEARAANLSNGITGMLLYRNELFIQVIEGEPGKIEQLYKNIKSDKRHYNVHLVSKEYIDKREFSEWTMGFKNISPDLEGSSFFLESTEQPIDRSMQPSTARKLLATFRDMK